MADVLSSGRRAANGIDRGNFNRQRFASARSSDSTNTGSRMANTSSRSYDVDKQNELNSNESRDLALDGPSRDRHVILQDHHQRWRYPDLKDVIAYLSDPSDTVKVNAAAYLQHLCYGNDAIKAKTRELNGLSVLVRLIVHPSTRVHRSACGALRNLSFGRANDENKRAIKRTNGVAALVVRLKLTTDNEVRELVTGILWNLSSCPELKKTIIDEALIPLVECIVGVSPRRVDVAGKRRIDRYRSSRLAALCNALGVIRNVSSHGEYARRRLRNCPELVESLIDLVRHAVGSQSEMDGKSTENCVCILRNLSYACEEINDSSYLTKRCQTAALATTTDEKTAAFTHIEDETGCCNKRIEKSKDVRQMHLHVFPIIGQPAVSNASALWQPEVVNLYLPFLERCTNPETLEAAVGALHNLTACDWQPSVDIRHSVRNEKLLPVIVDLLNIQSDKVVCATAIALRNLAVDQRNRELIALYATTLLVKKLSVVGSTSSGETCLLSSATVAAILSASFVLVKANVTYARWFVEAGGIERLSHITHSTEGSHQRVVCLAVKLMNLMWNYKELHEEFKKRGWKHEDFIQKSFSLGSIKPGGQMRLLEKYDTFTLTRPSMSLSGPITDDNHQVTQIKRRPTLYTNCTCGVDARTKTGRSISETATSNHRQSFSHESRRFPAEFSCSCPVAPQSVPLERSVSSRRAMWYMDVHDGAARPRRQLDKPVSGRFIRSDDAKQEALFDDSMNTRPEFVKPPGSSFASTRKNRSHRTIPVVCITDSWV